MKLIQWAALICCLLSCSKPSPETTQSTTVVENPGQPASDIPAGAVREKYPDNASMEKVTIKDGSGQLSAQGTLVDGKKEGSWTELNSNGTLKSITPYVNGKKRRLVCRTKYEWTVYEKNFLS